MNAAWRPSPPLGSAGSPQPQIATTPSASGSSPRSPLERAVVESRGEPRPEAQLGAGEVERLAQVAGVEVDRPVRLRMVAVLAEAPAEPCGHEERDIGLGEVPLPRSRVLDQRPGRPRRRPWRSARGHAPRRDSGRRRCPARRRDGRSGTPRSDGGLPPDGLVRRMPTSSPASRVVPCAPQTQRRSVATSATVTPSRRRRSGRCAASRAPRATATRHRCGAGACAPRPAPETPAAAPRPGQAGRTDPSRRGTRARTPSQRPPWCSAAASGDHPASVSSSSRRRITGNGSASSSLTRRPTPCQASIVASPSARHSHSLTGTPSSAVSESGASAPARP